MLKKIWKKSGMGIAALCLLFVGTSAQAVPTTELALGIDRSGSISSTEFALQRDAYASVLADPNVLPQDGSVAIGVWSFGVTVFEHFALAAIDGSNIASLITAINGMTQFNSGGTALGPAIESATTALTNSGNAGAKKVIDISTDGSGNSGTNQVTAANNAIAAGVDQVNCLGVGSGANCNFAAGTGSFSVTVSSFGDFEQALRSKILRETGQVPAPATLALFGLGLLVVGAVSGRTRRLS